MPLPVRSMKRTSDIIIQYTYASNIEDNTTFHMSQYVWETYGSMSQTSHKTQQTFSYGTHSVNNNGLAHTNNSGILDANIVVKPMLTLWIIQE